MAEPPSDDAPRPAPISVGPGRSPAPLAAPAAALEPAERERYARQLRLGPLGEEGQRRLKGARIALIGAGGIGSPLLLSLAAAGVGAITVIDPDRVEPSNLARQLAHGTGDVGRAKAESAVAAARALNPLPEYAAVPERLDAGNAEALLAGHHLVLDGSDDAAARQAAAAAAAALGIPLVWGSALGLDGVVTVLWPDAPGGGFGLEDVFPVLPVEDAASCETVGVLGAVTMAVAAMMAAEAVKLLAGFGEPLLGRVAVLDGLDGSWREIRLAGRARARTRLAGWHSVLAPAAASPPAPLPVEQRDAPPATARQHPMLAGLTELTAAELAERLGEEAPPAVIDLRERDEARPVTIDEAQWLPMSELLAPGGLAALPADGPLVFLCAHGVRSLQVAALVAGQGREAASLAGGAEAWGRWTGA